MEMGRPRNTLPMMTGQGQFGSVDMGGMFTVVKVREGISSYADPGPYKNPPGTVAHKVADGSGKEKKREPERMDMHHHDGTD
jgi:manganese oxidase